MILVRLPQGSSSFVFLAGTASVASRVYGFLQVVKRDGLRLFWYSDLQELEKMKRDS